LPLLKFQPSYEAYTLNCDSFVTVMMWQTVWWL